MKKFALLFCALSSISVFAADNSNGTSDSFSCMDKETFEIDSNCISTAIETNDKFVASQKAFYQKASQPGDYVMATLLMDPVTLHITVIAHREKNITFAKVF